MEDAYTCPVCEAGSPRTIHRSRYAHDDPSTSDDPGRQWADRAQRDLVFTHWRPGGHALELTELLCEACGFVWFSPRPSAADIQVKYEEMLRQGITPGGLGGTADEPRARATQHRLRAHLPAGRRRVLDVGGGDGRLLAPFLADGDEGFVVDYAAEVIPGAQRLGATLDDLGPEARFDAAILSHVLEHVADPVGLLGQIAQVAPLLYVEVPVEIWRGTPIAIDPVIHVNYFTEDSLANCLHEAGWEVLSSDERFSFYGSNRLEIAWCVARVGAAATRPDAAARVTRRLDPTLRDRLRRRRHADAG